MVCLEHYASNRYQQRPAEGVDLVHMIPSNEYQLRKCIFKSHTFAALPKEPVLLLVG